MTYLGRGSDTTFKEIKAFERSSVLQRHALHSVGRNPQRCERIHLILSNSRGFTLDVEARLRCYRIS